MRLWDKQSLSNFKHILGWILRPKLSYLRFREILRARNAGPVKDNISLDKLPPVTLIPSDNGGKLDEVLQVYIRNPSPLHIAPRSSEAMARLVAEGFAYYLIADHSGRVIGAICWQSRRAMVSHLAVDYEHRSGGIGIAAMIALENLMARHGHRKSHLQVFKNNRRALSLALSTGYKIGSEDPEGTYHQLSKDLIPTEDSLEN